MRASFKDGIFASLMLGVTNYYVIPFALFLGASVQQVGWVSGVPTLLSALSQLFSVEAVHRIGGRLKLLVRAVSVQAASLLFITLLAWVDFSYRVEIFLLLLVLFSVSGAIAGPAWGSLMTKYIPKSKRGRYFGWRSQIMGAVSVASMIVAGLLLYSTRGFPRAVGFFAVFLFASLARFVSAYYLTRMTDVAQKRDPASDFTFFMFLARFKESNFVKFVAAISMLTFAAYLSGPFFVVFMLRDLHFNYLTYMALQVASALTGLIALPWLGSHADLVGNVRLLRLTGFLVALVPLFWLVSDNVLYLALVQMLAGFAWSGLTLCATNFIYDAVTPQKRVRCLAYFNVIYGTAIFLGAALGGFLASKLPTLWGSSLLSLFALSAFFRLLFYFGLFRSFREVRPSKEVSFQQLFFSVVGIRPLV